MEVLDRQAAINRRIAKRVPVIAQKSTQEEPQKTKRTGFLGIFGKKEKPKPTGGITLNQTCILFCETSKSIYRKNTD